jgi:hypothetical protein
MLLTGGIAMCHGDNVVTGGKKASTGEGRIIGVDVAMQVMRVEGAAADGRALFRKKLSRPQFARFLASQPLCEGPVTAVAPLITRSGV